MRSTSTIGALLGLAILWAPLSGCSDSSDGDTGSLKITMTTEGTPPDPDGYSVTVGSRSAEAIGANGTITVPGLAAGTYHVTIGGLAQNCFVEGENPLSAVVNANAIEEISIHVTCISGGSRVNVTGEVVGADPDPDGYLIAFGEAAPRRMPADGSVTLPTGALGRLAIAITDVAPNCTLDPANPTSIDVAAGQTAELTIRSTCTPTTGALRITVTLSGSDLPDPGYTLAVDGEDPVTIGETGILLVEHLTPGAHQLLIVEQEDYASAGLQMNCSLAGGNPQSANVAVGTTTEVALAIACVPLARVTALVTTDGNITETDGYAVALVGTAEDSPSYSGTLPVNGTAEPIPVLNGEYQVAISGAKGNCYLVSTEPDPARRVVTVSGNLSLPVHIHCDPTHQVAVVRGVRQGAEIGLLSTDGSYTRLTTNAVADSNPAWSPSGTQIAFASSATGNGDIYVMDASGGDNHLLFGTGAREYQPAWSPDGSRIAFVGETDGNADIYVMNADGSNVTRLTSAAGANTEPAWISGSALVFVTTRGGHQSLYRMNADGTGASSLSEFVVSPSVSPAGNAIVAIPTPDNPQQPRTGARFALALLNASGSQTGIHRTTVSGTAVSGPAWGPDGRIAYASHGTGCQTSSCTLLTLINADGTGRNYVSEISDLSEPAWRP